MPATGNKNILLILNIKDICKIQKIIASDKVADVYFWHSANDYIHNPDILQSDYMEALNKIQASAGHEFPTRTNADPGSEWNCIQEQICDKKNEYAGSENLRGIFYGDRSIKLFNDHQNSMNKVFVRAAGQEIMPDENGVCRLNYKITWRQFNSSDQNDNARMPGQRAGSSKPKADPFEQEMPPAVPGDHSDNNKKNGKPKTSGKEKPRDGPAKVEKKNRSRQQCESDIMKNRTNSGSANEGKRSDVEKARLLLSYWMVERLKYHIKKYTDKNADIIFSPSDMRQIIGSCILAKDTNAFIESINTYNPRVHLKMSENDFSIFKNECQFYRGVFETVYTEDLFN